MDEAILDQLERVRSLWQKQNEAFLQLLDLMEWEVRQRRNGYFESGAEDVPYETAVAIAGEHRFEIKTTDFPKSGDNLIGYVEALVDAHATARALSKIPGCSSVTIIDRITAKPVIVISGKNNKGSNT